MSEAAVETDLVVLDGVRWQGAALPGERLARLLALLAEAAPAGVIGEDLVDRIWSDERPEHPEKALQVLVSRARSRTSPEAIERTATGYRLGLPASGVDLLVLRRRVADARAAHAAGDVDVARLAAEEVCAIRVGASSDVVADLLAEARQGQAAAARILGSTLLARGDFAAALPLLRTAAERRPDDEDLLAEVLRAEAEVSGVPRALERYAEYADGVRDRVGAEPGPALRRLHTELLARDAPVRAGLQYDATGLVGRDEEIAQLRGQLHHHRVVSIIGPGGLGKTRVAHLLGRLSTEPVVHFVELVSVRSPEGVLPQLAQALGVLEAAPALRSPGRRVRDPDLWSRVVSQLAAPTLLILDNCEHVVDAVADMVARLVGVTDTVRVLTTSRAPLGIAAEHVHQLSQLPDDDAVELFEQRARSARGSVRLDDDEVRTLVARLDGLPLAIELAAAKTRVMSVAEITRRLEDRFALLTQGDRSAPDRHRTLEAVIAWSWNLLGERDQTALSTLSILPDGFGIDAAEHLLGGDAFGCLAELADQSLLVVHETDDGVRYRFLETVREFGINQLEIAGESSRVRAAVRDWVVDFADRQLARLFTPEQPGTVAEVQAEAGNLTAALRTSIERADAEACVSLMGLLSAYWTIRGDHLTMLSYSPGVLSVIAEAEEPPLDPARWRLVLASGLALLTMFGTEPPRPPVERLEDLGAAGDGGFSDAARRLVLDGLAEGDPRPSLEALAAKGNRHEQLLAWVLLTHVRENAGDLDGAIAAGLAALELVDDRNGPWARAQIHGGLGSLCAAREEIDASLAHIAIALPIADAVRADDDAAQMRVVAVLAALATGRLEEARAAFAVVEGRLGDRDGDPGTKLNLLSCRAELALAAGDVEGGLRHYRSAAELSQHQEEDFRRRLAAESLAGDFGDDAAPWTLYTLSVVVFAHCHHGRPEQVERYLERLRRARPAAPEKVIRVDFPVLGSVLLARGAWDLVHDETAPDAVRRIALARALGCPRFQPVMSWANVEKMVDNAGRGEELAELLTTFDALDLTERLEAARALD